VPLSQPAFFTHRGTVGSTKLERRRRKRAAFLPCDSAVWRTIGVTIASYPSGVANAQGCEKGAIDSETVLHSNSEQLSTRALGVGHPVYFE
jgi:hypothetical protein